MNDTLLFEIADGVATVTLNDPSTLNALTTAMCVRLDQILDEVAVGARAMVIAGAGRAFCSGANLGGGLHSGASDGPPDIGTVLERHINPLMEKLQALPLPWVSAVRGAAAGFGAALAIAADLVVAGESAYFLQAFANIGLVPDSGATWLLTRAAGRNRAMELMLLGEKLPAAKAHEWGLVNRLVPDDSVEATAHALARKLADGPTRALAMTRAAAWAATDGTFADSLALERRLQREAGWTLDAKEGQGAFLEKRKPRFLGK